MNRDLCYSQETKTNPNKTNSQESQHLSENATLVPKPTEEDTLSKIFGS